MVGVEVVKGSVPSSGKSYDVPTGVRITGAYVPEFAGVLTKDCLEFVATLARKYSPRVTELLARRQALQAEFDAGKLPDFLPETEHIREGDWSVLPMPADFQDRRVEITGPTDRKMVINALNSGANVYMPDFEDSNCPTWDNMVRGQVNLKDAVRRTITFDDPKTGKHYELKPQVATLTIRPRGWHLWEHHVLVDGQAVPGGLFDFAVFFFNNAQELLRIGSGPYFYLPKMQHHLEARVWNEIFVDSQAAFGIPVGTIKATCLLETLPAAFQMEELIYELRDHSAGLNCGRWDYIFSYIKTLRSDPTRILPDRATVTMTLPFMRAYTSLVIKTCHKRGAFAIGGMSASIPVKDEAANAAVLAKVREDKTREVLDGHDGSWVAHPGLIPTARAVFDELLKTPNQIHKQRPDVEVTAAQLIEAPEGPKTRETVRNNINVCIGYVAAWLSGNGCVPLHNLMEDAATAEISRAQVWQWVKHSVVLDDGKAITPEDVRVIIDEELQAFRAALGNERFAAGEYVDAAFLTKLMILGDELHDFLTLPAQDIILAYGK